MGSGKDTDSNGKKDDEGKIDEGTVNKLTSMVGHMHLETGLTPSMKKLSVEAKTEEDCNDGSPKPRLSVLRPLQILQIMRRMKSLLTKRSLQNQSKRRLTQLLLKMPR